MTTSVTKLSGNHWVLDQNAKTDGSFDATKRLNGANDTLVIAVVLNLRKKSVVQEARQLDVTATYVNMTYRSVPEGNPVNPSNSGLKIVFTIASVAMMIISLAL